MASQTSDQKTGGAERVSFEVERVAFDDQGRLLVSGRWFGVRGRRFVRPTLTLTVGPDGAEQRSLADLEHKPWAAEDGEPWLAAFPLDIKLEDAEQLELSVAPDIAVELAAGKGTRRTRGRARPEAADARAPACAPTASGRGRRRPTRATSSNACGRGSRRPTAPANASASSARRPTARSRTSAPRLGACAPSLAACDPSWTSRRPRAASLPRPRTNSMRHAPRRGTPTGACRRRPVRSTSSARSPSGCGCA